MDLYTKLETAAKLRVSVRMVERLVERGDLTATRLGTCVRFSQDSIDQCIRRLTVLQEGRSPKEVIMSELAGMGKRI